MIKIGLQKSESKKSSNTSMGLDLHLKSNKRLLLDTDVSEVVSEYEQYRKERSASTIVRLTAQVNVVASNVLFNDITEVVKDEGSNDVILYNGNESEDCNPWSTNLMTYNSKDGMTVTIGSDDPIHPTNAIRNTSLSAEDGIVYHCGRDMFNNHLLRSKTFKTVCAEQNGVASSSFNTIADMMRDVYGNSVREKVYFPISANKDSESKYLHLYDTDSIGSFMNTMNERLVSRYNGSMGFYNRSKIVSYKKYDESEQLNVNKPIASHNEGDFIDMYPTMDLYLFPPKYNKFKNRVEKNWDCCVTYPFSSTTEGYGISIAMNGKEDITHGFLDPNANSVKAFTYNENTYADNGSRQYVIYSLIKHGLSVGDYVNIYKTDYRGNTEPLFEYKKVEQVVDDYVFTVLNDGTVISDDWVNVQASTVVEHYYNESNPTKHYYIYDDQRGCYHESDSDGNAKNDTCYDLNESIIERSNDGIHVWYKYDINVKGYRKWNIGTKTYDGGKVNVKFLTQDMVVHDGKLYRLSLERGCYMRADSSGNITENKCVDLNKEKSGLIKHNDKLYIYNTLHNYYIEYDSQSETQESSGAPRHYVVEMEWVDLSEDIAYLSYKKNVGGIECSYYVRLFTRLPNFRFASGDASTLSDAQIAEYRNYEHEFDSQQSRLAFAKNIYSDQVGEVVFTDDLDVANLKDNLGRPLTTLYLSFFKTNRGFDEWYGFFNERDLTSDNIEFSHCFGPITCAFDLIKDSLVDETLPSIKCINNIDTDHYGLKSKLLVWNTQRTSTRPSAPEGLLVSEIDYTADSAFYGDIVCFDETEQMEQVLDTVYHRFGSAQRESIISESHEIYRHFYFDEIKTDDFDTEGEFVIDMKDSNEEFDSPSNNRMEGYYYKPFYEIPIKSFGRRETIMPDFLTVRYCNIKRRALLIFDLTATVLENHYLQEGDEIGLCHIDGETDEVRYFYYTVTEVNDLKTFKASGSSNPSGFTELSINPNSENRVEYQMFKLDNLDCPSYARVLKDGSCRLAWRDVYQNGMNDENGDNAYPFINGALYINKTVDLFVRRQDAEGMYGLWAEMDNGGVIEDATKNDVYYNEEDMSC